MSGYPETDSFVLVAIMPSARDMEIARLLGWYRIPLKSSPKVLEVDYLAFYQTAAFGKDHRWRIESFAEVKGHELTTRRELFRDEPDHPRAEEEYFKVQIGPLQTLPEPIFADHWKRITFLYTTGRLFQGATSLKDLAVNSEEREVLWRALRERASRCAEYRFNEEIDFELDPIVLAMLGDLTKINEDQQPYLAESW